MPALQCSMRPGKRGGGEKSGEGCEGLVGGAELLKKRGERGRVHRVLRRCSHLVFAEEVEKWVGGGVYGGVREEENHLIEVSLGFLGGRGFLTSRFLSKFWEESARVFGRRGEALFLLSWSRGSFEALARKGGVER